MNLRRVVPAVALGLLLAGCATKPQDPIQLAPAAPTGRVGVVMTKLPAIDTQFPGAGCLLCIAAASLANSALTTHARTLSAEDLPQLKTEVAGLLRKKGADVVVIDEQLDLASLADNPSKGPNMAPKNFAALQKKFQVDKLVVLDISAIGFLRTYSAYVPTSDPKGLLRGTGYMVNLGTNAYEWYLPVDVTRSADKVWDEPPKFPGLTNAYYQTIEAGKDSFLKPFVN